MLYVDFVTRSFRTPQPNKLLSNATYYVIINRMLSWELCLISCLYWFYFLEFLGVFQSSEVAVSLSVNDDQN